MNYCLSSVANFEWNLISFDVARAIGLVWHPCCLNVVGLVVLKRLWNCVYWNGYITTMDNKQIFMWVHVNLSYQHGSFFYFSHNSVLSVHHWAMCDEWFVGVPTLWHGVEFHRLRFLMRLISVVIVWDCCLYQFANY